MAAIVRIIRRLRADRGAELIEMAMVTPILLLITAGIFDFGMLFRSWEVVTNAAREGARVGTLPSYAGEDIRLRVEQYMAVSGVAGTCDLEEPAAGDPCTQTLALCQVCVQTGTVSLSGPGTVSTRSVTVSTRQPLPSLSVIGTFFGGAFSSINVASTSQMRTEVALTPPAP
jgi:Flp pilus assembly protein TadG